MKTQFKLLKTALLAAVLALALVNCSKDDAIDQKPSEEGKKPVLTTAQPTAVNETSATVGGKISSNGNLAITEIGLVFWRPDMFTEDIGKILDNISITPRELINAADNGSINLGTVGGGLYLGTVGGGLYLGTQGGGLYLGTVGGGLNVPGDSFQELLNQLKVINANGYGEFSCSISNLPSGKDFIIRAYAVNNEGISFGNPLNFDTEKPGIQEGNGVTDIRGNAYKTLIIDGLEWMAENLKTDRYADNTFIPSPTGSGSGAAWLSDKIGMRKYPNNITTNWEDYGYLYNWHATQNPCGLCPNGWRMPTKQEWDGLLIYLGGANVAGSAMKTVGHDWWKDENEDATNSSGFSVRGAGSFSGHISAFASGFRNEALFWSDTQIGTTSDGIPIPEHYMFTKENGMVTSNENKERPHAQGGASIRCVKK